MEKAVYEITPDHIIHLGDHLADAEALAEIFPRIPMTSVPGNCDLRSAEPQTATVELGGVRFFVTHGHTLGVKYGLMRLDYAAREALAEVALFGHTHCAMYDCTDGLHLLNPGACGGGRPTCGVVEIDRDRRITCKILNLD